MRTFTTSVFTSLILITAVILSGCSSTEVKSYKDQTPKLVLEEYFNGTIDAHGIFQDRSGKVVKRFSCVIVATWSGNQGVLDESFTYSDGSTSKRIWKITKHSDGKYSGRAEDVVGEATGEASGNALQWNYVLSLKVDDEVYKVNFDDWMFLMDQKIMLNRSIMSKFGYRLGELSLTFIKR